ncbi:MAG: thioredoxin domain-containing protein [Pirellula sp.]|nr:thioredoxin domain-containing protein [Pirellula sp.]
MTLLLLCAAILATAMQAKQVQAAGEQAGEQIEWSENLAETMKLAQSSGKPVLVHFYGDHCPPCRMLEKKAFKDQQLIAAFDEHILAVRINAEQDTKTAAMFRVNRWPTDVYLYANGDEIYRNISAQDPGVYEKTIVKVAEKNQRWIAQRPAIRSDSPGQDRSLARADSKPSFSPQIAMASGQRVTQPARIRLTETSVASVDTAEVSIAQTNELTLPELPNPLDAQAPKVIEALAPSIEPPTSTPALTEAAPTKSSPTEAPSTEPLPTSVALNGFCPVSLSASIEASQSGNNAQAAWVKGSPEFAVRHRGRVYHCVSQEMLAKFLEFAGVKRLRFGRIFQIGQMDRW